MEDGIILGHYTKVAGVDMVTTLCAYGGMHK